MTIKKQLYILDSGNRYAGLFSYFMQAIYNVNKIEKMNQLFFINYTHDMLYIDSNMPHTNVWDYYFTQPICVEQIDNTTSNYIIDMYIDNEYKGIFNKNENIELSETYFKYFKIQDYIQSKIDDFYVRNMKGFNVLGVHKRGTDHIKDGELLTFRYYVDRIDEELKLNKYDKILICTDEKKTLDMFIKTYGDMIIYYDSIRVDDNIGIHYGIGLNTPYVMGEDVTIEVSLLSKCNFMIRTMSNVTSAVLILNPYLQNRLIDIHIKYNPL
jgi:hypothetical protein